jgi:hypothetical protein
MFYGHEVEFLAYPQFSNAGGGGWVRKFQAIDACAAALPLFLRLGESTHTRSPETSAFAEASADEAADKSAVPERHPHPTRPGGVRERK